MVAVYAKSAEFGSMGCACTHALHARSPAAGAKDSASRVVPRPMSCLPLARALSYQMLLLESTGIFKHLLFCLSTPTLLSKASD
eukprot:scaffold63592_cov18-Tisochrysis_lutea.AAC.1